MRDIALGLTAGEAYANSIHHVGIECLTGQWWWDIFENVVFFGDPDLRVFSPEYSWEEPEVISIQGLSLGGHTPEGASKHPNEIEAEYAFLVAAGAGVVIAVGAVTWGMKGKKKDDEEKEIFEEKMRKEDVEWEY